MDIITRKSRKILDDNIIKEFHLNKYIFLDIEATGFNKIEDKIFSIALGYIENNIYKAKVIFEEEDETLLLQNFLQIIGDKNKFCTFNGKAFDEPFLQSRLEFNGFNKLEIDYHIDLYRIIRLYKSSLNLEGISLKSLEKYLGIERKDNISGKECKELFYEYMEYKNKTLKEYMIIHNLEDILYLPRVFYILKEIKDKNLKRDNLISKSQVSFIKYLIKKRKPKIKKIEFLNLSKKEGSKIIYHLQQKTIDEDEINNIIKENKSQL